jgi:hypothetical protein
MLIVAADTIITAFPKRWGRNKLDDSGVHKSIRVRLKMAQKDGIKSIYHLGKKMCLDEDLCFLTLQASSNHR